MELASLVHGVPLVLREGTVGALLTLLMTLGTLFEHLFEEGVKGVVLSVLDHVLLLGWAVGASHVGCMGALQSSNWLGCLLCLGCGTDRVRVDSLVFVFFFLLLASWRHAVHTP